ncbi:hypothetical protein [Thermicanus aegyptius]|uniref:hypothetical protein n=1 Tax=Thermicanus aegyptius TaxID=94009 RepID=UPI0004261051|nr:hypothetical protein [Thermicanus aegyptius]
MVIKWVNRYVEWFLILFILLFSAGCDLSQVEHGKGNPMAFHELLTTDLSKADRVEIQFSDGTRVSVSDPKTMDEMISQLEEVKVKEKESVESVGVGSLYYMDFMERENRLGVRYGNTEVTVNGKEYIPVKDEAKKLDQTIIEIGREKNPELLSGVK